MDQIDFKPVEIADLKKQNFAEIKKQLEEENDNFEDELFPKAMISIGQIQSNPRLANLEWMRPKRIAKKEGKKPKLFSNGPKRCDVNQGMLGDCWFLATLATLPSNPQLFNNVVPADQDIDMSKNSGIYRFKFWQYGEWVDVVIDDYIPTLDGRPCFLKSDTPNEFWPCMIEKAYAKLYGNYTYALDGGLIGSSMEDLTGGVAESYHDPRSPAPFKVMLRAHQMGSLMGACIWGRQGQEREEILKTGLASGHAYSITKVVEFEANGQKHQLVRVRNPWGNRIEWTGAWSDKSSEWEALSDADKFKVGFRNKEDGEFFMTYEDFNKHFDGIDICHVSRDSFCDKNLGWHKEEVHGMWEKGTSLNTLHEYPQYCVELKDSDTDGDNVCTIIVSLLQRGGRRKRAMGLGFDAAFSGLAILMMPIQVDATLPLDEKAIDASLEKDEAVISGLQPFRANTKRFEVPPGKYVIIPATEEANTDLKFMLRLFSEMPAVLKKVN